MRTEDFGSFRMEFTMAIPLADITPGAFQAPAAIEQMAAAAGQDCISAFARRLSGTIVPA